MSRVPWVALAICLLLAAATPGLQAQDDTDGGGGGLYGDLYILERDEIGAPILDAMGCEQPTAEDCSYVPLMWWRDVPPEEEEEPCDVDLETATSLDLLPREVDFGRLSVARSPQDVLDRTYEESKSSLNLAADFGLDPTGRLLLATQDPITLETTWRTIDSPLENLCLYQQVLLYGYLSDLAPETYDRLIAAGLGHLVPSGDPSEVPDVDDMLRAASFVAAAADKTGLMSLDAIVHTNTYLGINPNDGAEYFDLSSFTYDRKAVYPLDLKAVLLTLSRSCPARFYECFGSKDVSIGAQVDFNDAQVCRDELDIGGQWNLYGGAQWFAQAAEDSREAIWFVHNWEVPETE